MIPGFRYEGRAVEASEVEGLGALFKAVFGGAAMVSGGGPYTHTWSPHEPVSWTWRPRRLLLPAGHMAGPFVPAAGRRERSAPAPWFTIEELSPDAQEPPHREAGRLLAPG